MFSAASKNRLTRHDLDRFPGGRLFDRLARAVCEAGCLPRKELYEAWEVARRTRRLFRGGRVVDVGGGHGLLAHVMLLLDDSSPSAVVVDPRPPKSAAALQAAFVEAWPRLAGRVEGLSMTLDDVDLASGDLLVSSHACGTLADRVLERAVEARAPVAVLPCCHERDTCDAGALTGWVEFGLGVDIRRALRLEHAGYRVWTQTIPGEITPKNRLLLGAPRSDRPPPVD